VNYQNRSRLAALVTTLAIGAACALAYYHYNEILENHFHNLRVVMLLSFLALVLTAIAPHFHRDKSNITPLQKSLINDSRYLLTVIPAHNEDETMFRACLDSIIRQTRQSNKIHVVENGNPGYVPKLAEIVQEYAERTVTIQDHRYVGRYRTITPNIAYSFNPQGDKRAAQMLAVDACPGADYIATVDSDVELADEHCYENGLKPFADRKVMSVCGFLTGKNHSKNLLTRLIEISFICSFLNGRASYAMLNSVGVNTGGLAFYRAFVWRKYRHHYMTHKIFGRRMSYGDDAMMTRYCLLEGKTLFQRSAHGYTLHPENMSHLRKQRVRWHRSWFWGNLWLMRTFSIRSPIWWLTFWQFLSFVFYTAVIPLALLVGPITNLSVPWMFWVWIVGLSYVVSLPYLTAVLPTTSARQRFVIYLLAPLSSTLNLYIGWFLRYVGMFTCLKTGWSTRKVVEVGA